VNNSEKINAKVSIGMSVRNGEKRIRRAVESLLSQTHNDFELIISDNASTDSTPLICNEMAKKDRRIRYIYHMKRKSMLDDFNFLLKQAKNEYFFWAAADDVWKIDFLEKNLRVLESNDKLVGSVGLDRLFDESTEAAITDPQIATSKFPLYERDVFAVQGSYKNKIRPYLAYFPKDAMMLALYRTERLRKRMVKHMVLNWCTTVILNVLHEGDLHVIDEVLMYKYVHGVSTTTNSYIQLALKYKVNVFEIMIGLYVPFTFWCIKNIGIMAFMENFSWFFRLNLKGWRIVIMESTRLIKRTICRQKRWW
jgi:glycosyltransferase involved in cell wall biosynthesis